MKKSMIALALALVLALSACAGGVTESDEYQDLELEVAELEQQLSETAAELAEERAALDQAGPETAVSSEVPAEVSAVLDEWWAANERRDGSVVELYVPGGYHQYGDQKVFLGDLAEHFDAPGWTSEWITEPYLIAAEPEGRYVVTRGVRNSIAGVSTASALTFEILTTAEGELKIAETDWTDAHG